MFPEEIESLARRVVVRATERSLMIVTAESCTGGLVTGAITEIAGSSAVLDRGFVTYSNAAKARIVREGSDVTIVSYSIGVGLALQAAEELAGEGIDAEVIDLRTLRPLDREAILTSLAKTNRLVVAEEGWPVCSIASEVIAICMEDGFDDLDAPVLRVCNEDVPLPYAANLEKAALIDVPRIVATVKKVCNR